ncbi:MAG: DUF418 domain-containing protein [Ferruginibacter sp.]
MQQVTPVKNSEREMLMDVLRGFAILGIFIANLRFMSLYNEGSTAIGYHFAIDGKMSFLHAMFVEGKFYSIFSLLFGWGIAMQFQRIKDKGIESTTLVKRRLRGMLLLGFMHLIILWTGDIVAFYAMLGFLLLFFRNMNERKLLIWGTILVLSPIVIYFFKMNFLWLNAPAGILFETNGWIDEHWSHLTQNGPGGFGPQQTATWIDIWKLNIAGVFGRYGYLFFVSRIPKVLGMFLVGYWLGKNSNYKKVLANNGLLKKIALAGFIIGLPMNYMLAQYMKNEGDYFQLKMNGFYQTVVYALGVAPLALAYAASIALVYKAKLGRQALLILQPVGKMAFSNYIMHSLIGVLTFYGVGLGMGGQFGPTAWTIFALVIFSFQIIFSSIWLSYFNYGPLEWFWRSMTYKKWQPMRKGSELPAESALG